MQEQSVKNWLALASSRLGKAHVECGDPSHHAQQILRACTGWSAAKALVSSEERVSDEMLQALEAFLSRRLSGEPFQYITGREGFWRDEFAVGPGVLIPRRETEHVVEYLCSLPWTRARVLELGAGSGNIGISVLRERTEWTWWACERSSLAFSFAAENANRILRTQAHIVAESQRALHRQVDTGGYFLTPGDFFAVAPSLGPCDVLVSNPPYIASTVLATLSPEVRQEPEEALDGGPSGLVYVERLGRAGLELLRPGGRLVLEIGSDQGDAGLEILRHLGYEQSDVLTDLAGLPRVLIGRVKGS